MCEADFQKTHATRCQCMSKCHEIWDCHGLACPAPNHCTFFRHWFTNTDFDTFPPRVLPRLTLASACLPTPHMPSGMLYLSLAPVRVGCSRVHATRWCARFTSLGVSTADRAAESTNPRAWPRFFDPTSCFLRRTCTWLFSALSRPFPALWPPFALLLRVCVHTEGVFFS